MQLKPMQIRSAALIIFIAEQIVNHDGNYDNKT